MSCNASGHKFGNKKGRGIKPKEHHPHSETQWGEQYAAVMLHCVLKLGILSKWKKSLIKKYINIILCFVKYFHKG